MKQRVHRALALLCLFAAALCLGACGKKPAAEVLTQKPLSADKIPVTVLVKSAFLIHGFEKGVEARFPQLDLIQVGNFSSDRGVAEYEARLRHDDLTDMVMTWPLDVGRDDWPRRLMDLSAFPFSGKYSIKQLDTIAQDGKLYYLPGPSQVRGIVYNQTLFEEKGWEVPDSFEGFVALCKEIEASGIRSLQLGFENEEVLDTAFVGYGVGDCFSKPEDLQWLADYDKGKGDFGAHFGPALDTFEKLVEAGVFQKGDLQLNYADRERMLFNRECAMVEDSVIVARMGKDYNGCTDRFALMPFFNPGEESDWVRIYPVCYIGLNLHLQEPQNKEKLDLICQLLDYVSTPEGQAALMGDSGAMYSSLQEGLQSDAPEVQALQNAMKRDRVLVFPTLKNAQSALRKGLQGMVGGTLSKEDVVAMVNRENCQPPVPMTPVVFAKALKDFSLIDTGSYLTDEMCKACGAEIGLFLDNGKDGTFNGKGLNGRIYEGPQTVVDVTRILPDLRYDEKGELWKIEMTGENLLKTLEYSILVDHDRGGWFYYFSGLRMDYAPGAEPGSRIRSIRDQKGEPIDPQRLYSIAVMDQTVPEELIAKKEETGQLIAQVLENAFLKAKEIAPSEDGRFVVCAP